MRKKIFEIVEQGVWTSRLDKLYDIVMLIAITASIIPLMFAENHPVFRIIEIVTVSIFIVDYILRWITADYRMKGKPGSFLLYPFTGWAIIDLLSILPAVSLVWQGFKILRITRLLRIIRLFKLFRYSNKIIALGHVLKKERKVLLSVLCIAVFYIFITALVMFNAEPHFDPVTGKPTFKDFFDALYWSTVTLTTVGYGDMIPATNIGRFVSMLSALFGVAIIALPSGVITASYLDELRKIDKSKSESDQPDDDLGLSSDEQEKQEE